MTVHLERGLILLRQRRPQEAIVEFRKHVSEYPEDSEGFLNIADAYNEMEEHEKAEHAILSSLSLAPNDYRVHQMASVIYLTKNELEKAEVHALAALEKESETSDLHYNYGLIFFERSEYDNCLKQVEYGLKIDPKNLDCLNLKAKCFMQQNKNLHARKLLDKALAIAPDYAWTHENHGWRELRFNTPKKAFIHFQDALRLNPQSKWAQEGIRESIKRSNVFFKVMYNYGDFLCKGTLRRYLTYITLTFISYSLISFFFRQNVYIRPFLFCLLITLLVFTPAGLMFTPLGQLYLTFSNKWKHLLSKRQRTNSLVYGSLFFTSLIFIAVSFYSTNHGYWGTGLIFFGSLFPLRSFQNASKEQSRKDFVKFNFVIFCIGLYLSIVCGIFNVNFPPKVKYIIEPITFWFFFFSLLFGSVLCDEVLEERE